MGCFTTACAMSRRQIRYNEPIVAFVISAHTDHYNYNQAMLIHAWDKYSIMSLPLYGKYDDYGGIELDDSNEFALSLLRGIFPNNKDITVDGFEHDFMREPQKGRDGKEYHLGLMMIHRDTYDFVLANYSAPDYKEFLDRFLVELNSQPTKEEILADVPAMDADEAVKEAFYDRYYEFNSIQKAYSFSLDFTVARKYGKLESDSYDDFNRLSALSLMNSSDSPIHWNMTLYQLENVYELKDKFLEQFEHMRGIQALALACNTLGVQFAPSMYTGQDHTDEESLAFHLHQVEKLLKDMANDDYEYGPRWDRKTDTETYRKDIFLVNAKDMLAKVTETFDHYHEKLKENDDHLDD